jgi:hypothetical protein
MSSLSNLLLLATLAGFSLFLLAVLNALDRIKIAPRQKMFVFRLGLGIFVLTPVLFVLFKIFSVNTLNISLPALPFNPKTAGSSWIPARAEAFSWAHWVFRGYLAGVGLALLKLAYDYASTWNWLRETSPGKVQNITVKLTEKIQSPLSFGLFRPEIYLPKDSESSWSPREIQMSLRHEQTHLENHDPQWKMISLTVRGFLFFAPWAYALHRKFELEMEICCDETTRAETGASLEEYGLLLLAMITPGNSRSLLTTNMTNSNLQRRILAMKSRKIQRPVLTSLVSLFLFLAGTTAIAASSGIGVKKNLFDMQATVFMDGRKISSPHIITRAGEAASITQTSDEGRDYLKIEMLANDVTTPEVPDAIGLSYDFTYKYAAGGIDAHEKFQVLLKPKKEGMISFVGKDGHNYEMRIIIERVQK